MSSKQAFHSINLSNVGLFIASQSVWIYISFGRSPYPIKVLKLFPSLKIALTYTALRASTEIDWKDGPRIKPRDSHSLNVQSYFLSRKQYIWRNFLNVLYLQFVKGKSLLCREIPPPAHAIIGQKLALQSETVCKWLYKGFGWAKKIQTFSFREFMLLPCFGVCD